MYTRTLILSSILALITISVQAGSLSPAKGWRVIPSAIHASSAESDLSAISNGQDAAWQPSLNRSEWIAFKLPAGKRFLLTFACTKSTTPVYAVLERSADGADGPWETVGVRIPKARLDKFAIAPVVGEGVELSPQQREWWRIRFAFRQKDAPSEFKVTDIGLYSLDSRKPDYWLDIGASIQAQSIRNDVFKKMVKERFPGFDPIMFNLAVGGWNSKHLRDALPRFLREHPDARYVCIHIGGNNVTPHRPYPGGADELKDDLIAILDMLQDAGKIPILSRLSYRAYKGSKPVPPEENGSGPYVTAIYDPLMKQYCPDFVDKATGLGVVDAYTWFKNHQDELSPDGVHVNPKGAESWNRLWAEHAGGVVYRD